MKKFLFIITVFILFGALETGCAAQVSSSAAVTPSSSSSSPSVSYTPIPTTPPDVTPETTSMSDSGDEDTKSVTLNGNVYYLDNSDPIAANFSEDPPLHVKKTDGNSDQELGIRGFQFDIIGNYIYVDSNDPDLNASGAQTWSTIRMNLDGSGKKVLEYGSMSARFIPQGEQTFYFTTLGDSAIYISDFSCENVTTMMVDLPDKSDLDKKLDKNKVLQLNITDVSNGLINFDAIFSSEDGTVLYDGLYTITVDGKTVEKIKGTYYYYSSQNDSE